jgi:hypothetical protein
VIGHHHRAQARGVDEREAAQVQDQRVLPLARITRQLPLERGHPRQVELTREPQHADAVGLRSSDLEIA